MTGYIISWTDGFDSTKYTILKTNFVSIAWTG